MSRTCSVFAVVLLLLVQFCTGEKSCTIWSSAGPVVRLETTFTVYCSFNCNCKGSMSSGHPPAAQSHNTLNSTTIYFKVVNITKNRTYSCHCGCSPALDPCGLDISAGYLPDRPTNVSCSYKVKDDERGDVFCAWNGGRDTFLRNSSTLRIRAVSGNHADERQLNRKGTDSPSGSFPDVPTSVQLISVWVRVQNLLGSAKSSAINYTLRDIVMPSSPDLVHVDCFSRSCNITVKQPVRIEHLEIQYTAGRTWTTYAQQVAQMSSAWSISSLEPYRRYHFKARSKFATGLWSEWSSNISGWTEEEAPAKELDVWYAEPAWDVKPLRVFWKEPHVSISRGNITGYRLRVHRPDSGSYSVNVSADARNYTVPSCSTCKVTVWARNSKGLSPPASVTARYTQARPPQNVRVTGDKHRVAIYWTQPVTAWRPVAYVVEWYPVGHKMEELRWVRLSGNDQHVVVTDVKASECYEGAVFVFYDDNSAGSATFAGVATQETAPTAGPQVHETVEDNKVSVTWPELPRDQRMGCITKYTIYLEGSCDVMKYSVSASERGHVIQGLSPDSYSLWMTASTAAAEGPPGPKVRFVIQKSQLSPLLVCVVVFIVLLLVVCLCQCSAVKQRFWMLFQCLMLDVVPDPANSKWAKECSQEKGKMSLQVQLSNSSSKEEEEPILAKVEELPKQMSMGVSSQYPAQTPDRLLYPATTYITSLSHNSDSSDHTHSSMDTTVDYISNQEPGAMHEEEDEEEVEEFSEFFPSPVFMEQLDIGGRLTLDSVQIS